MQTLKQSKLNFSILPQFLLLNKFFSAILINFFSLLRMKKPIKKLQNNEENEIRNQKSKTYVQTLKQSTNWFVGLKVG